MPSQVTIARGQQSSCADPVLDLWTTVGGLKVDLDSLEFTISELVTDPDNPTQVYPGVGRATVDVTQSCADGGGRISLGHWVADWTVPDNELVGNHVITWFFKLTAASPEQTFTELFEVVPVVGSNIDGLYATVQDLYDEGVPSTKFTVAHLLGRIEIASRMIDRFTGRWFYPRDLTIRLDGRDLDTIALAIPIIDITAVEIAYDDSETTLPFDLDSLRIYNRHITQGLTDPDDRNDPRISIYYPDSDQIRVSPEFGRFPRGRQNVIVSGTFGYTDPDGSATGCTPALIKYATTRLTIRNSPKLAKAINNVTAGTIWKQQTRQQRVEYGEPSKMAIQGAFTGDPEIDQIIVSYKRPIKLGAPQGRYRRRGQVWR